MSSPRVWLITGASSGFGLLMTELILRRGEIAIATLRNPAAAALDSLRAEYPPSKLLVLPLDVTSVEQVLAAFTKAVAAFGRVDVVFNNAGYAMLGEVEGMPEREVRGIFEVNFMGAMRVSCEAVRVFREVNRPRGGRLLQVSSSAAAGGVPAIGYYIASKRAMEGASESMAAELDPEWNIKVVLLEPGACRTHARDNIVRLPPHPAYTTPTLPSAMLRSAMRADDPRQSDACKVVEAMYETAGLPEPPMRMPLGKDAVALLRKHAAKMGRETEAYAAWSEGLAEGLAYMPTI